MAECNRDLADILIIDDDSSVVIILNKVLKNIGRIRFASDAKQAFSLINERLPDLILLDVGLPDIRGIEVCSMLKKDMDTHNIPVLFITSHAGDGFEEEVFEVGAADYIIKPLKPEVVAARVKTHLEYHSMIKQLDNLAHRDSMTGLSNRRTFDEKLAIELKRCQRERSNLAVAMIDIDEFKKFNDNFGHVAGDECLKKVALTIANCANRPGDVSARYGGEEFSLILPNTEEEGVNMLLVELINNIKSLGIRHSTDAIREFITVSIGYTIIFPNQYCTDTNEIVKCADDALYQSKQNGRNQITFSQFYIQ